MRDWAWPSVKLFAPATGAPGLFPFLLLMALLFGPSLAGGFCASAPLAARTRAIAATDIVRIVTSFELSSRAIMPHSRASSDPFKPRRLRRVREAMRHVVSDA